MDVCTLCRPHDPSYHTCFVDGTAGLHPHIAPDSELIFDLTLLGFRPRLPWIKPLIQTLGDRQKPFEPTDALRVPTALKKGMELMENRPNTVVRRLTDEDL